MKNFVRALRHCYPYRYRLAISIICAGCAAALWGLAFTSIQPVLRILSTGQNLQTWVDDRIDDVQKHIDIHQDEIDKLHDQEKRNEKIESVKAREQREREVTHDLARHESKLETYRTELYRYQLARKYIYRYFPTGTFQTLSWIIFLVVASVALKGIFEFSQETLVGSVVNLSLFDLRNRFYRNVVHLDLGQFNDQGTSELMARFTNDMELVGNGQKVIFGRVIGEPLRILSCVILACYISWQLTMMFLILVPIALFVVTKVSHTMKRATRRLLERMSNIYKILKETFEGIRVVKAFTMEPYERRRFHAVTRDYYRKSMLVVRMDALTSPLIEVLGLAAVAAALLAGAYLVLTQETRILGVRMTAEPLESETLLQLYALLAAISDPVRKLSSVFTKLQSGVAASDRVFAFLDREPRVTSNGDGPRVVHQESIEFRNVCFSYDPHRAILTHINASVSFGETIAVVGKNGCGKTTLLGLLPRFYDPDHGSVLIDGQDIRNINLRFLRRQIGVVTQDPILFDDSIYNNIAYGNRRASAEDVEAAARKAFLHDIIMKLKDGYKTRIGEAGAMINGGMRQKIALARAIIRDPRILILDEFTSQYDAQSEAEIHEALRGFMRQRTTLVITHRLKTLEIANRILVLDNGRLAAIGTHNELMNSCLPYQRLQEAHTQRLVA
jgi:ATP-binding cassette subfamily B protein/subfamily B ATP-binding cassette protein MsbA